jgi:hypothetical protein
LAWTSSRMLLRKFKKSKITIIEPEPSFAKIFSKIGINKNKRIKIIYDRPENLIFSMNEKFDLIIADLFTGFENFEEKNFFEGLKNTLNLNGYLITNVFSEPEKLKHAGPYFSQLTKFKSKDSTFITFRRKDFRVLPEGYIYYRQSKAFLERECKAKPRFKLIGHDGAYGQTWGYGPWKFENYYGDEEPAVTKGGPYRMIMWQPITRKDKPKGWHRLLFNGGLHRTGFADLELHEDYRKGWSEHAKRHAKKWDKEKDTEWELIHPSMEEFLIAYKRTQKDFLLKKMFIDLLEKEVMGQGDLVRIYGARRVGSESLEAGFVCIDIPEIRQSLHLISFIHEDARNSAVGYGLMDEWFKSLKERGIRFADFGTFWAKGDPRSWKGFSKFKGQFGIQYINYKNPLVRWTGKL